MPAYFGGEGAGPEESQAPVASASLPTYKLPPFGRVDLASLQGHLNPYRRGDPRRPSLEGGTHLRLGKSHATRLRRACDAPKKTELKGYSTCSNTPITSSSISKVANELVLECYGSDVVVDVDALVHSVDLPGAVPVDGGESAVDQKGATPPHTPKEDDPYPRAHHQPEHIRRHPPIILRISISRREVGHDGHLLTKHMAHGASQAVPSEGAALSGRRAQGPLDSFERLDLDRSRRPSGSELLRRALEPAGRHTERVEVLQEVGFDVCDGHVHCDVVVNLYVRGFGEGVD
ncbi:hypothetical protein BDK51DRAFT_50990 [Blyttiomyces helicus]|uniref:Uncharacterized protein n=1 Tax=Blyttiomyces helicus TaxID=388810 RepID=A0A4P9WFW1_9FUNG|nr:hypothetical protein BDK51DRAFT_50990 [Blyttiomyces helicus]|eukprot:RKO91669.1 hypothetical protein BDK51DRAFT_50990 [Blyttiomyces helicus]